MERNSFTGQFFQTVNLSLTKGFNLPEARVIGSHAALEFRADAFNLFNLTSLSSPTSSIISTAFGQSSSGLGSRVIELQARFSF